MTDLAIKELAERIYNLDSKAYENSKSTMGKTFPASLPMSVKEIIVSLETADRKTIANTMTVIGNMIKTIPEGKVYRELEAEYDELNNAVMKYIDEHASVSDISMSAFNLQSRYESGKEYKDIICISREFGSGGHEIGYLLSKELGYAFYDKEIFEMTADALGEPEDQMKEDVDEALSKESFANTFAGKKKMNYVGISSSDAVYFKQSQMIIELAQKQDCIFLGRCADVVLQQQNIPCCSIFIGAPTAARVQRKMQIENISQQDAERLVKKMDKQRKDYYKYYTGREWGYASNYDLCINSATYGIPKTLEMILHMLKLAHGDEAK